ncbi:MAG: hypothetical protein ABIP53_10745 [Candidatus Limnocylindrales bacterium]
MRITIDLRLAAERITARLSNGKVVFDDVAQVTVKPDTKGRLRVAGIGSERPDRESTAVLPVVSQLDFQPTLAASIAWFIVQQAWGELRPGWRGPLSLFDHVDARVALEGPTADERRSFAKSLPHQRGITWWVNGEMVKN